MITSIYKYSERIVINYHLKGDDKQYEIPKFTLIEKKDFCNWIFYLSKMEWMDAKSLEFLISSFHGYFDSTNN